MQTRVCEFELLDDNGEVTYTDLPVEWDYAFYPGSYSGKPEDCYPDDEDAEIYIENIESILKEFAPSKVNENMKLISKQLEQYGQYLPDWASEERS